MARTVSRSGDNGQSTPVGIPEFDGVIEEHKANPQDLITAKTPSTGAFKGMKDIEVAGWIENLMNSTTNFSSPKGSFKLKANGIHGSVQSIDEAIRRDPFVLRAVQRGKIRFLTDEEAEERSMELVDEPNEHENHLDHLMESLGPDASNNNGMYKIPLPDEAEPKGPSQTPAQVWAGSANKPESPKNFRAHVGTGESEFTL